MRAFKIVAYSDSECGLKERRVCIKAENYEQAKRIAWTMFPEYHQIGVFEQDEAHLTEVAE